MGQLDDELSGVGAAESQQLGRFLAISGDRPSAICSSPQRRAVQTAEIMLDSFLSHHLGHRSQLRSQSQPENSWQAHQELQASDVFSKFSGEGDIPIQLFDELKELNGGIFEGLTWSQAQVQHPALCQQLEHTLDWLPVPGSESPASGFRRAHEFWDTLFNSHVSETTPSGCTLWIVTHSGILQHLIATLLGCDRTWGLSIPNTACFEFWLDGDRWHQHSQNRHNTALWQIRRFNDTSHLHD